MKSSQYLKSLGCMTLLLLSQGCSATNAEIIATRREGPALTETNRITEYKKVLPQALAGDSGEQLTAALVLDDANNEVAVAETGIPVSWVAGAWLERAAISGNAQAMYLLSDAYRNGWYGKPKQSELADYWIAKAKQTESRSNTPIAR